MQARRKLNRSSASSRNGAFSPAARKELESMKFSITPLPGYKEPKPMVFCGLFPANANSFESLKRALDKLALNDSAFVYQAENSDALGFGFRCGFLGLLHMEIVQERLEREFDIELVQTAPNVTYEIEMNDGELHEIDSPAKLPDAGRIDKIEEPVITAMILTPSAYV